jgi:hypothetical protein
LIAAASLSEQIKVSRVRDGEPLATAKSASLALFLAVAGSRWDCSSSNDHGSHVDAAMWSLFRKAVHRFGPRPTSIEWDTNIPPLEV